MDDFIGEFYQIFKDKLAQPFKISSRLEEKGILPKSFYDVIITLLLKQDKAITTKLQTNITYNYKQKNS